MSERELIWQDDSIGLNAVVVIDDTTLGPAAGGTRTKDYSTLDEAVADARALARAMTLKCALAGLDAGGTKIVVRRPPDAQREAVFRALGERIASLDGTVRTAGDFGTRERDLEHMAASSPWVHLGGEHLAASTGRGLLRCVAACALRRGTMLASLRIAVQGCGAIGKAVARALAEAGARVFVADLDVALAERLASELGAEVFPPTEVLTADVDIVAPCAIGGVIDERVASRIRAWAVVGAANNIMVDEAAVSVLRERERWLVPDVVASAGAVVDGVGETVMGLSDRGPLIDALGGVAMAVFDRADADGVSTPVAAERMARERIASARSASTQ